MKHSKTEEYAFNISKKVAAELGFDIYDVQYVKEGPHWFLRIFIEGVSLDGCEKVSRALSRVLDKDDFIKENYFLEVSSPGIERALRRNHHYAAAAGERIRVMLKDGESLEGVLTANDDEKITIDDIEIDIKSIKKANIMFDFDA